MTKSIASRFPRIMPGSTVSLVSTYQEADIQMRACHHVSPSGMSALPVRYVEILVLINSPIR